MLAMPEGADKGSYSISDISGRTLINARMNNSVEQVDISHLASGLYMIHMYENGNEVKVMKFVKE